MQPPWSFEEMLDAFRSLGGTAENIRLDDDEGGLSPRDPDRPVLLRVPEKLLLPQKSLEFAQRSLRLQNEKDDFQPARDFLEHYERVFARGILAQAAATVAALDSLPEQVKEVLSEDFGMRESIAGDQARRIESAFTERRAIQRVEGPVVAPVLELAKYDPTGFGIQYDGGIKISGSAPDGIRIFPAFHDALAIFQRFGFAAGQPAAFSLPMSFVADSTDIAIGRKMYLGERHGEITMPQLTVVARDSFELSHLMLGHSGAPRLARGIFRARLREAGLGNADAHFDRIVRENTGRLLRLLDVLEGRRGETILTLRKMARHQLEAMSWSIGAHEI